MCHCYSAPLCHYYSAPLCHYYSAPLCHCYNAHLILLSYNLTLYCCSYYKYYYKYRPVIPCMLNSLSDFLDILKSTSLKFSRIRRFYNLIKLSCCMNLICCCYPITSTTLSSINESCMVYFIFAV
jgi:hypothetical protein